MGNCSALIKAIDAYIAKADDDLTEMLDKAGFAEPNNTVDKISVLEEKTAAILEEQANLFDNKLEKVKSTEEISAMVEEFEAEDMTDTKISGYTMKNSAQLFRNYQIYTCKKWIMN